MLKILHARLVVCLQRRELYRQPLRPIPLISKTFDSWIPRLAAREEKSLLIVRWPVSKPRKLRQAFSCVTDAIRFLQPF